MELVDEVKRRLDRELRPDGYNVGFNAGEAAGQTVMHLHVHVIPRYRGDIDDPRGGVRHVIPGQRQLPSRRGGHAGHRRRGGPFARHVLPLFDRGGRDRHRRGLRAGVGLDRIDAALRGALARGARVRIVTGDYLEITQASALECCSTGRRRARSRTRTTREGGRRFARDAGRRGGAAAGARPSIRSRGGSRRRASVSRSSGAATCRARRSGAGIEWNLRVERDRDAVAYAADLRRVRGRCGRGRGRSTAAWVDAYAKRARARAAALPPGEEEAEPLDAAAGPHAVQQEALAALREAREEGRRRALVVLATGLGKTWLAAFDLAAGPRRASGATPRVLFLAHRRELLGRRRTYRRQLRARSARRRAWGGSSRTTTTSARPGVRVRREARPARARRRARSGQRFDYVVVDEVHHAAARLVPAASSTRIDPGFLLGLTATPGPRRRGRHPRPVRRLHRVPRGYRARHRARAARAVPLLRRQGRDRLREHPVAQPALRPGGARRGGADRGAHGDALAGVARTPRAAHRWCSAAASPTRCTSATGCGRAACASAAVYAGEGSDDRDGALEALEARRSRRASAPSTCSTRASTCPASIAS